MKKLFIALLFTCASSTVSASWTIQERAHQIFNYRGIIHAINYETASVTLEDYSTKLKQRFVASHKPLDGFKVGDEVKIYFRPGTFELLSIKKMTPVEYIEGKQNNGFMLKREDIEESKKYKR